MHSIKDLRNNIDLFKDNLKKRFFEFDTENILNLDQIHRKLIQEKETLEKDTIQELKDRQNLKAKKKKDSSKLGKFLKKLGVEEPEKKKPEFEIDQ